jgi:mitochondrial chaperone BCS1
MFELIETLMPGAMGSDVFAGGLALGIFGMAIGLGRVLVLRLWHLVVRRVVVRLTLDNRTVAYRDLYAWITEAGVLAHARHVRVTDVRNAAGDEVFGPAPGRHWFWRNGRLCIFDRAIHEKARVGGNHAGGPMETVTVSVICGRMDVIMDWVRTGAAILAARRRTGPALHILRGDWWDDLGPMPGRSLDTVVAEDDRVQMLAADLRRFLAGRAWYAQRGVPWRRGYLLYGPPGTGKSSVIRALATDLGLDIATLDLTRPALGDDELRLAMMTAPKSAILAIEDVDAVFVGRDAGDKRGGVSFSGLLNAIDGVAAQEGRALIMTTNHRERLDPALIRPGRTDLHVELGLVGAAAAERLFLRFHPGEAVLAARFAMAIGPVRFAPAVLQGVLLQHADDPVAAITAVGFMPQKVLMAAE